MCSYKSSEPHHFYFLLFLLQVLIEKQKLKEDLDQVQILKPVQVKALTVSVVKVRKAVCSSGEGAGLEDLKGTERRRAQAGD